MVKSGDRTSGTQIWIGRSPCLRNRSRCAVTLSRVAFRTLDVRIVLPHSQVTCNLSCERSLTRKVFSQFSATGSGLSFEKIRSIRVRTLGPGEVFDQSV